jgi:hypothetical protein
MRNFGDTYKFCVKYCVHVNTYKYGGGANFVINLSQSESVLV